MAEPGRRIIIVGSGPGGYVAAIKAAQLGADVTVVEDRYIGGTCLNVGCIPTKALLATAAVVENIRHGDQWGIEVGNWRLDLAKVMARKEQVVKQLTGGVSTLFQRNKVKAVMGRGRLTAPNTVVVDTPQGQQQLTGDAVIVATGSEPAELPGFDVRQPTVLNSTTALEVKEIPQSILIVGGGAVGCEFASIFAAFGSQVTIVEMLDQLLPIEDRRLGAALNQALKRQGIATLTGTVVDRVLEYRDSSLRVRLSNGEEKDFDRLLLGVGRKPNSRGIGLEDVGVRLNPKGFVEVDDRLRTNVPGVYAIGDVTGKALLAHVASAQGIVAVENILGHDRRIDYGVVPSCTYTLPEVASVGLTPDRAAEQGIEVNVGRFPFAADGKALAANEPYGWVQIVAEKATDQVLGAQIIGAHATELIHELAIAIQWELTSESIGTTIHAHPTLSEAIAEAAHATYGKPIHIFVG